MSVVVVESSELEKLVTRAVKQALFDFKSQPAPLLDVDGAAELLTLTREAVRTLAKRRQLPIIKLPNGKLRFDANDLLAWARGAAS